MSLKSVCLSLLKGVLAGLAIGFGGFLYIAVTNWISEEIGKILGALLFPIGLFMVCAFNLFLYTGKIGLIFEKKQTKKFYIDLPLMFIGNIAGAMAIGYICYAIFKNTDLFSRAITVSNLRTSNFDSYQGYLSCFIKSFFCGTCVYLAVKSFAFRRMKPVGILLLAFFIGAFVYLGLEHCIANAYYFSFANSWENPYVYVDMALCVLGNSLGTLPGVFLLKIIKKD